MAPEWIPFKSSLQQKLLAAVVPKASSKRKRETSAFPAAVVAMYECPITHCFFVDPVVAADGNTYVTTLNPEFPLSSLTPLLLHRSARPSKNG